MENIKQWYEREFTLEQAMDFINTSLLASVRNYVEIGFYLKAIRDRKLYLEAEYKNFEEFVRDKYDRDKSWASRCIKVNDQLSKDGNSPLLSEEYREYKVSQLVELAYMTDEQRESVSVDMTVKQLQSIRKPEPEVVTSQPGPVSEPAAEISQPESIPEQQSGEPQQESEGVTLQLLDNCQHEVESDSIDSQEAEPEGNMIDAEFEEIQEQSEPESDIELIGDLLKINQKLLNQYLNIGITEDTRAYIRQQELLVAALEAAVRTMQPEQGEPEVAEQPDLPLLKNNEQRAAFLDAYETWPLWIETEQTGERYYRYDLEDGTSMVVKVYHAMLFDYKAYSQKYEDRFTEGYGRHEYYLLQSGKFFRDCDTNRPALIEKLKKIQKVKKGNGDDGHEANQ